MIKALFRRIACTFNNIKLARRIQLLAVLIIIPFSMMFVTLLININIYNKQYDQIITNASEAGRFGIDFKEDFDNKIYLIIRGHSTFEEEDPYRYINDARDIAQDLIDNTTIQDNQYRAKNIIKLINNLEKYTNKIEENIVIGGHYDDNIAIWENDVQIVTALIQETVYEYSYLETKGMEQVREDVSASLGNMTMVSAILFSVLTTVAIIFSFIIPNSIAKPIVHLNDVTSQVAKLLYPEDGVIIPFKRPDGDLGETIVRHDEISRITKSYNEMADAVYTLVNNLEEKVKERTVDLEQANMAIKENKEKLQLILDSTAEAIYGIDENGNCTFCNASCIKILGYTNQEDLLGKNMHKQIHHSRKDGTPITIDECKVHKAFLIGEGTQADDEVFWRADGTCFDVAYYSHPQYKDGNIVGAVVTFTDNTERKRNEENIRYLSCHDSLTGVFNRMYFEDQLKIIDTKKNLPISIIFGDINGLKLTNDIFGHAAGDELIKRSAEILKRVCREEDIVARVGGDEFIVLLPNTEEKVANKIIDRIKAEFKSEKHSSIRCSISLGCDTKLSATQAIEITMGNAENNMYKEKMLNRKTIDADMINTIVTTLHDKSPREKDHSIVVSQLCDELGQVLGLHEAERMKLKKAGYIHDLGKVVVNETTIRKQGALTQEEKNELRQHVVVGYRILNLFDDTLDLAKDIYSHHERWDGTGYPKGLKGEKIPLIARIIAVAECYDRMVHDDTGTARMSRAEALLEIKKNAGTQFDPGIADAFVKLLEEQPVIDEA